MKFDISKVKALGAGLLASGKKNAPTLMTAGSIVLGWVGVYLFWVSSKKAEQRIEFEEACLNQYEDADRPLEEIERLPAKEKLIIYLQYCWMAGLCGVASTALAIGANSVNLSRIAELTLLAQAMSSKDEKQKALIEKLKEKVPEKEIREIKEDLYHAEEDDEEIVRILKEMKDAGDTRTLFKDEANGHLWKRDLNKVVNAIDEVNTSARKRRSGVIRRELEKHKSKFNDPFYAESDTPWWSDQLTGEVIEEIEDIYSTIDVSDFMYMIGETSLPKNARVGEVMEFRCFGDEPAVPQSILNFDVSYRKKYFNDDPTTPNFCRIDYMDYIYPSHEFVERGML